MTNGFIVSGLWLTPITSEVMLASVNAYQNDPSDLTQNFSSSRPILNMQSYFVYATSQNTGDIRPPHIGIDQSRWRGWKNRSFHRAAFQILEDGLKGSSNPRNDKAALCRRANRRRLIALEQAHLEAGQPPRHRGWKEAAPSWRLQRSRHRQISRPTHCGFCSREICRPL